MFFFLYGKFLKRPTALNILNPLYNHLHLTHNTNFKDHIYIKSYLVSIVGSVNGDG